MSSEVAVLSDDMAKLAGNRARTSQCDGSFDLRALEAEIEQEGEGEGEGERDVMASYQTSRSIMGASANDDDPGRF
jgi:hypothetical protein